MKSDIVLEQVADVADAVYRRTDEVSILLARAITREVLPYGATVAVPFEVVAAGCADTSHLWSDRHRWRFQRDDGAALLNELQHAGMTPRRATQLPTAWPSGCVTTKAGSTWAGLTVAVGAATNLCSKIVSPETM
jgi:hypothetical protein